MNRLMKTVLVAALLPSTLSIATPSAPDAASVTRGKQLYMQHVCYSCHGTVGQGGERNAGPKLTPNPFPYEAFVIQMRQPRAIMPRYSAQALSDQELQSIYHYVLSIKPSPAANDIPLLRNF